MKNLYKYIFVAAASTLISGCGFLEVDKIGKNDTPKHFSDVEGLRTAIAGTYRLLYNFYDDYYMKYAEVPGDMLYLRETASVMRDEYNFASLPDRETSSVGNIWRYGYETIVGANTILYYAPDIAAEYPQYGPEIDRIMAEALFVRAACMLFMCNTYGQPYTYTADASHLGIAVIRGIPGVNEQFPRNTVAQVYTQIISDCTEAIKLFGDTGMKDVYHASGIACTALLARVYLYMEEWEKARDAATEVIDAVDLTGYGSYLQMFMFRDTGDEAILRLNGDQINSHSLRKFYGEEDIVLTSGKFRNTFYNDADIRLGLLSAGREYVIKYEYSKDNTDYDPALDEKDRAYAPFVLRCSEMYLIRAEANARLGNEETALSDLKSIIGRATNTHPASVNIAAGANVLELVKRERILELAFEGHRFFDIIRYKEGLERDANTTSSVQRLAYPNNLFILPIPQREMDSNDAMIQNPGYN